MDMMKLFEMKMRGFPLEVIAEKCDLTNIQVESKLKQLFPTFDIETNEWLKVLEEICLFRGMNDIVINDEGNMTLSNMPRNTSNQVTYLDLAFRIREFRYVKWRDDLDDLEREDNFE